MVKTRIAPSPTGPNMHIGNFRTALYSYFWAKKNKGEFILRVEDTDRKRFVAGSIESFIELFDIFGIALDKSPSKEELSTINDVTYPKQNWFLDEYYKKVDESEFADFYIQTHRIPVYLKYAIKLVEDGFAYLCFLSEEELKSLKETLPKNLPFRSPHKALSKEETIKFINEGKPYVVRLDVENYIKKNGISKVDYRDLVLGQMQFDLNTVDDQVLVKSNGIPTYHLGVVVDDYLMKITHPIRGYGWLPSTPKQIMIYKALGLEMPPFAHVTDILDPSGKGKLSKRRGAVFTSEFIKQGFLPESIVNFISLLGWSPKIERKFGEAEREIFSMEEIIELFDLSGLSNANPIFDINKLIWFNKEYIKLKSNIELKNIFTKWLKNYYLESEYVDQILNDNNLEHKIAIIKERIETLFDLYTQLKIFYVEPNRFDSSLTQIEGYKDKMNEILQKILEYHQQLPFNTMEWKNDEWAAAMKKLSADFNLKPGDSFMVLRLAIAGSPFSPPLFEVLQQLGKEQVLHRIELCLK